MQVSTGQILCNARYKRINGVDCFVNMENTFNNDPADVTTGNHNSYQYKTQEFAITTSSDNTKFSEKSLLCKNYYLVYFPISESNSSASNATLAFWAYFSPLIGDQYTFGLQSNYGINYFKTSVHNMYGYTNGGHDFNFGGYQNPNTWIHYMLSKTNGTVYMFINGILIGTRSDSTAWTPGGTLSIRSWNADVYFDDIVLIRDECLATSNFTIPDGYLLDKEYDDNELTYKNIMTPTTLSERKAVLPSGWSPITGDIKLNLRHMEINGKDYLVDVTKANKDLKRPAIEYTNQNDFPSYPTFFQLQDQYTKFSSKCLGISNLYSIYIYLSESKTKQTVSSEDYTISCWVKIIPYDSGEDTNVIYLEDLRVGIHINIKQIGIYQANRGGWDGNYVSITYPNDWFHCALIKQGNVTKVYINGTLIHTGTSFNAVLSNIFELITYRSYFYIDDIVLIEGQALWTSNFTVPTTYLVNDDILTAEEVVQAKYRPVLWPERINDENILKVY